MHHLSGDADTSSHSISDSRVAHVSAATPGDQHLSDQHLNGSAPVVTIDDAHLLFSGQFSKAGLDLVVSGDGRAITVHDYFKSDQHATLFSPEGASLSGAVVDALVGNVVYAQAAGGAANANPIGHVAKLSGSASVVRNGVTVELNVGDNVFKGDVVQSGTSSALGISFIDGTAFSLASNARMVLNDMVYDPNGSSNSSFLSLVQGAITFVAGQTAKNGSMKIDTPVATMGIRGTAVLCEISANNGPTKFSVLVEPGNHVGSFILYNKVTGAPLGSVSQAGMVTLVTPAGLNQLTITEQAKTLTDLQAEKDIIQQVFSIAFPKFNDANPKAHFGSIGSGVTPFDNDGFYPFPIFGPADPVKLASLNSQLPDLRNSADFSALLLPKTVAPPPQIIVTNASAFQSGGVGNVNDTQSSTPGNKDFTIADHVTIINSNPADIPLPFVAGTAQLVGVTGPATLPVGFNLQSLVSLNPQTGVVTYDPSQFQFLAAGEKAVFTIAFDSASGPGVFHETLEFTVNGLNDVPVFGAAQVSATAAEAAHQTGSSAPITETFALPFQDPDFSNSASGYQATILSAVASGATAGLPQDAAARDAELRSFLTAGSVSKNLGSAVRSDHRIFFGAR